MNNDDTPPSHSPSWFRQLGTILGKNATVKWRSPVVTGLEILLPSFFLVCLVPAWLAVGDTTGGDVQYAPPAGNLHNFTTYDPIWKCKKPNTTDPKIAKYTVCEEAFVTNRTCIEDLCIRLSDTNQTALLVSLRSFTEVCARTVPDYDTVALVRRFARNFELPFKIKHPFSTNVMTALSTGDQIAVVGSNAFLVNGLKEHLRATTYTFEHNSINFKDEISATRYSSSREGSGTMWGIVVINSEDEFTIRMNKSATPKLNKRISKLEGVSKAHLPYFTGFLTMQHAVFEFLRYPVDMDLTVIPMPSASYSQNRFLQMAGEFLPLVLSFSFLFPVAQTVSQIVREKESRIREGMLVMGLPSSVFKLSWVLTGYAQMTVSTVFMFVVLKQTFYAGTDPVLLFLTFWLYALSLVGFSILLSVFFSKSGLAVLASPLIFLATVIPVFILPRDDAPLRKQLSFISSFPFGEAVHLLSEKESSGNGMTRDETGEGAYSFNTAMSMLIFDNVLYLVLAWYFDKVVPGEWGAKKPFYFIFWPPMWCANPPKSFENDGSSHTDSNRIEKVTDETLMRNARVSVRNLRKTFTTDGVQNTAVDNLNLTLHEGQIQVLLGHNGAGKTTLINMLTGMLPATSGDAHVYGHSVVNDLDGVRRKIGMCPQHNILWDRMTCEEHLRFFASIKGVPTKVLKEKVSAMLDTIGLSDKKHVYASGLSGGMKRALSVGIALIGDSKLVVLDEPTAGMDVQARRNVWDLLKKNRSGRTILLTTHFMDEADLLGDNIAILHDGKLFCQGSSLFLKNRLGVGYTLKIEFQTSFPIGPVTELISSSIDPHQPTGEAQKVELLTAAGSELGYRVPMWALSGFSNLFDNLETEGPGLGVKGVNISLTTLEEIFIKIAKTGTEHAGESVTINDVDGSDSVETKKVFEQAVVLKPENRLQSTSFHRSQWKGLLVKRYRYAKRDATTICFQLILPVVMILFALAMTSLVGIKEASPMDLTRYSERSLYSMGPADLFENVTGLNGFELQLVAERNLSEFDSTLLRDFKSHGGMEKYQGLFVDDTTGLSVFYNQSHLHSTAVSLCSSHNIVLKQQNPLSKPIREVNHPLPFSTYFKNQITAELQSIVALFILIPFTFIPANYVSFLVRERETKAKHVQLVSGVRLAAYWGATFLWDFATFLVTTFLVIVIFFLFDREEYVGNVEAFFALLLLLLFYGLTSIAASYLASFYFTNHSKAQNIVMLCNFMSGFVLVLTVNILSFIDSTKDVAEALRYVFRFLPQYALGDGILQLSTLPSAQANDTAKGGPFHLHVCGLDIIFLAIMSIIYLAAAMVQDFPELYYFLGVKKRSTARIVPSSLPDAQDVDEDVAEESALVNIPGGRAGDVVTVQKLNKVYPPNGSSREPKTAVKEVSFGVKQDEIFAFLGTNGAGKTTTLSVLSGDFPPTRGEAFINGHNVVTECSVARRELGYCPQFDALLDLLTPREHIELYASLRGVPPSMIEKMADALVTVFGLEEHQNKRCKSLSGGNKRKTSIAISLVGGPACVLLDEPTAGMDPVARRGLWTALQQIGSNRSVILTTHHLEEVEAVAHRMAVMVNGALQCMGSLTHLKTKFGGAYELEVKTTTEKENPAKEFFMRAFPGAVLLEATNCRLTYKIPASELRLSQIFRVVADVRDELQISDYSLNQTSLEQVFMAICRKSLESEG